MPKADLLDLEHLNREYSPSSCVDDINIYIQQYIDLSQKSKILATEEKLIHVDLQYGAKKTECLDLYQPMNKPKQKLLVYIHGGYWQELSKEESSFAATNLQQQGFHFAVIDYTLAPDASMSQIVEENRRAIAWLFHNAKKHGYNPEEIYVCGSSAGAHLAMMMLQTQWSNYIAGYQGNIIKGVCAVSGIYDLQPLVPTYVNDLIKMDLLDAKSNSPFFQALPEPVPVIIAYGEIETDAFKNQSKMMAEKLRSSKFKVQFKEIIDRNHFNVIVDLNDKKSWLYQQTIALMHTT